MESIGREPRELGTERRALLARDVPDLARREARRRAHHGFQPCAAGVADPGRGLAPWEVGPGRREQGDGSFLSVLHPSTGMHHRAARCQADPSGL